MKKLLTQIAFVYGLFVMVWCSSCANIIPPSGGPRDSLPPMLVLAQPKDSALNVKSNKIQLTFNEFVEVKDIQQNLVVLPNPKNQPVIDYKLHNVYIRLKDSLEPNTTYTLQFGNALRDVNESNIARNFSYVFATGNRLHNGRLTGSVQLAQTGKTDSTLIAVLHANLNDTAIQKIRPRYYAKLNGKGLYEFVHLMPGQYRLFVLPNDYSKKYDDSTKLFAFADSTINISDELPQQAPVLYAYQEAKKKDNPTTARTKSTEEKQLKYSLQLDNGQQDILKPELAMVFNRKVQWTDTLGIVLCDTLYRPLSNSRWTLDSTRTTFTVQHAWKAGGVYKLIVSKKAVTDTLKNTLAKTDTVSFTAKKESDYGSVQLNFKGLALDKHPVLCIIEGDKLKEAIPLSQTRFYRKLFKPGDYELSILYDANKNGVWDAGQFRSKRQPEKVTAIPQKLTVKANWDNEVDYELTN